MILDDAEKKISYFNKIGIHYEAVYHYIIRRRKATPGIYDINFLDDITAGLIVFDMQRMMGAKNKYRAEGTGSWALRLHDKLQKHRSDLMVMQSLKLEQTNLYNGSLEDKIIKVFNWLKEEGINGLNRRNSSQAFAVGASKILHFLIPDFFIILDNNARQELASHHVGAFYKSKKVDGDVYLTAMCLYKKELEEWQARESDYNFQKLRKLDPAWNHFGGCRETPLPRIIDKCTFVGDKWK